MAPASLARLEDFRCMPQEAVNTRERKKLERICLHPEGHKGTEA